MPTPTPHATYLEPATLAAVGSLELRARLMVEGLMAGMHRSPHRGLSVEFAEHRQYAPGDDLRHLDWKVFGRTDKLYLKQHHQETGLDLLFLIDVSGSMAYASGGEDGGGAGGGVGKETGVWSKYDHAASVVAVLSYLALRQQDRVGLVLFDEAIRSATRTSGTRDHWRSIIEMLTAHVPESPVVPGGGVERRDAEVRPGDPGTDLERVFDQVLARQTRRGLVVLISDLLDPTQALEGALARMRHRGHDVVIVQVLDAAELSFPFRAPHEFLGLEGEGRLPIDPLALRRAYLTVMNEHLDEVRGIARRFHYDHVLVNTSEPLGPLLSHFLARRGAAGARG